MLCACVITHYLTSANAHPQHGPLGCCYSQPEMNVTSVPPPSVLKGPSCVMGTSGLLQDKRQTSRMILLRHNNCWQVFPPCPPTSLSSIHQHRLPELCLRTRHGGREGGEIISRVQKQWDKPGKDKIRWLFVSYRVRKMPASCQVSCLVRSLAGAKRRKCSLWQWNRLWQQEMQTRGGLG